MRKALIVLAAFLLLSTPLFGGARVASDSWVMEAGGHGVFSSFDANGESETEDGWGLDVGFLTWPGQFGHEVGASFDVFSPDDADTFGSVRGFYHWFFGGSHGAVYYVGGSGGFDYGLDETSAVIGIEGGLKAFVSGPLALTVEPFYQRWLHDDGINNYGIRLGISIFLPIFAD